MSLARRLTKLEERQQAVWATEHPGRCRACGNLHEVPWLLHHGRRQEAGPPCLCPCCQYMRHLVTWEGRA